MTTDHEMDNSTSRTVQECAVTEKEVNVSGTTSTASYKVLKYIGNAWSATYVLVPYKGCCYTAQRKERSHEL
jgi:hypothetical protein